MTGHSSRYGIHCGICSDAMIQPKHGLRNAAVGETWLDYLTYRVCNSDFLGHGSVSSDTQTVRDYCGGRLHSRKAPDSCRHLEAKHRLSPYHAYRRIKKPCLSRATTEWRADRRSAGKARHKVLYGHQTSMSCV